MEMGCEVEFSKDGARIQTVDVGGSWRRDVRISS